MDFLKMNPHITLEDYKWKMTIPQIKLASYDYSHVVYLKDKDSKDKEDSSFDNPYDFMKSMGMPILKQNR